jgi:hypothetical protein
MRGLTRGTLAALPITAVLLIAWLPAKAADISVDNSIGRPPVVGVIGEINPRDAQRFSSLVAGLPAAIVALASPGGSLLASVHIGEIIRNKRFSTIVPDKETCASACALIWLAGVRRYVWDTARLGFHGAFDARTMETSGPGNAIVGAYLNKLGLSYEAVAYMTAASPTDMRWLHSDTAKRLGIAAGELSNRSPDGPISVENFGPEWKLKAEAVAFVMTYFNQWSVLSERELIAALALSYANSVRYNGAVLGAAKVLEDKRNWLQRWPTQNYHVRLESMTTNCSEAMFECMTTGIVDWAANSRGLSISARGSSKFSFLLGKVSPERFVIIQEDSVVLTKQASGR